MKYNQERLDQCISKSASYKIDGQEVLVDISVEECTKRRNDRVANFREHVFSRRLQMLSDIIEGKVKKVACNKCE